jgi:trimeric autotransporter adhesin
LGSPQSGVFTATLSTASGPAVVTFPLAPGFFTSGSFGPVSGTSNSTPVTVTGYMSADSTFFYANLTPASTERQFIYGGQAVPASSPLLTTAPTSAQLYTFTLQQDAALQSPIPFITQSTGGNIPNPSISPHYVIAPANSVFGAFNPNTNPNVTGTRSLQASLAINGQGTAQSSALVVQTGSFFTSSDPPNSVAGDGVIRGSYQAAAVGGASPVPVRIGSGAATVADGNGNNIFGTGTGSQPIAGFVLDQNQYNANLNFVPNQNANQIPLGSTTTTPYAFNQPATATPLTPTTQLGTRTTQLSPNAYQGYFGGIMNTGVPGSPYTTYAATGTATVQTNATTNRVQATFMGADAFAPAGTNDLTVQFGGFTGTSRSRSTFVDDARYAALEDPDTPSQVNGNNIDPATGARLAMVSSGVVSNSLLPPGGLCSSCSFLQWGYWTGSLDTQNPPGTTIRQDVGHLNFWVVGTPSVTLPATGVGTFSGNAIGSVVNNGANYIAAGQFTNMYNFGTHSGSFAINNFDGKNVSGTVNGLNAGYSGTLSGSGLSGSATGTFFGNLPGNPATETGGNFALKSLAGPPYLASGIFAGKR